MSDNNFWDKKKRDDLNKLQDGLDVHIVAKLRELEERIEILEGMLNP